MPGSRFAEVIVNKAIEAVNRVYHYRVPDSLVSQVQVGSVVMVPFGRQESEGVIVGFVDCPEVARTREIKALIIPHPVFQKHLLDLASWMADYYLCPKVSALKGMLPAGLKLSPRNIAPKTLNYLVLIKQLGESEGSFKSAPKQKEIIDYLSVRNQRPVSEVLAVTRASRSSIQALVKKGWLKVVEHEVFRDPYSGEIFPPDIPPLLTGEQQAALAAIENEYNSHRRPVLLFGVTGSGKTEVYLRAIENMLRKKKQAIVLVPEIALTPQMVAVFKSRLGEQVAVMHSGLSTGERRDAWVGTTRGHIRVVVGTRSAVFAPCPDLGMIIIDEEQEQSYKQENVPRFHAREVAMERSRIQGALLVLGSATPSVETYYRAEKGEYRLVVMEKRVLHRSLPLMHIIDMRQELKNGNKSIFSIMLQEKLIHRFARKEQSLLFLNRRGYYTFVSCRSCGEVVQCPHCAISLTYHAGDNRLKCHYCGYSTTVPIKCPHCGSGSIRQFGVGTQRVEEEVKKILPGARVARLDTDSTSHKGFYDKIYKEVRKGSIDILVGTQMIAKGLDFPRVSLVGILSADLSLNMPEIRAAERTFQLITQVAGRAGRGEVPGEVVLQTYNPEEPTVLAASHQNYRKFFRSEIHRRLISGYPPFGRMIRLLLTGPDLRVLMRDSELIARYIKSELDGKAVLMGPTLAPLERIKDRFRMHLVVKGTDLSLLRSALVTGLDKAKQDGLPQKKISLAVDVEPLNMM